MEICRVGIKLFHAEILRHVEVDSRFFAILRRHLNTHVLQTRHTPVLLLLS